MDILVVGGGGREHAIIRKLKESPRCGKLYCTPGNGGIARDAQCFDVPATDVAGVVALATRLMVDLVFVAPDDPLVAGMVDALEEAGISAFGPRANAAHSRGQQGLFQKPDEKIRHPHRRLRGVRQAGGRAGLYSSAGQLSSGGQGRRPGPGQRASSSATGMRRPNRPMQWRSWRIEVFGASGSRVVVEEFLTGPEVSVLAFTDGKTVQALWFPPRITSGHFDGDHGPEYRRHGHHQPQPLLRRDE